MIAVFWKDIAQFVNNELFEFLKYDDFFTKLDRLHRYYKIIQISIRLSKVKIPPN